MKKRILTMLLAVLLCAGLLPLGAAAADLKFVDVSPEAWYYNDVKTAVDSGLVNGKSETTYCPDDLLTYAEAVKLAACMNQKYETGVVSLVNGNPWYQSYVDYAKMKNIIAQDYDWNAKATRAGYMAIFAHALPDTALTAANSVPDNSIPDVPSTHPQAAEIYKLYRAGILQGSEDTYNGAWAKHLCKPSDNIKRSEVAAILTRMMFVDKRISFSMGEEAPQTADLKITKQPAAYQMKAADDTGASFAVEISGGKAPYKYQWIEELDGTTSWSSDAESKETKNTFAVKNAATLLAVAKAVKVYVVVTDAEGKKVTSEKADLKAFTAGLKIEKEPEPVTLKAGEKEATFSITVSGGKAPYEYYWVLENEATGMPKTVLSAETTSVFKTGDLTDDVKYFGPDMDVFCVVTDYDGQKVTSKKVALNADTLAASLDPLKIVKQPQNSSGKDGEQITLSIEVTGGTAPNYFDWQSYSQGEWQSLYNSSDTSIYRGNTESMITLRIGNDWTTNEPFRCVVTDAHGQVVTSNTVQITLINVTSPLKIVSQPDSKTGTEGTWVSFTVVVTGGKEPYTYRWESTQGDYDFIGGIGCATVNGETTATLWVQIKKGYYPEGEDLRCVITDADGNKVISNVVTATLSGGSGGSGGLLITKQPSDHWMNSSMEEVTFTITVEGGMPPYTFDWYYGRPGGYSKFDSVFTNMDSATGKEMFSDYDFEDLQTSDIDIYCVVTDDWGATVTSKICHIYQY